LQFLKLHCQRFNILVRFHIPSDTIHACGQSILKSNSSIVSSAQAAQIVLIHW